MGRVEGLRTLERERDLGGEKSAGVGDGRRAQGTISFFVGSGGERALVVTVGVKLNSMGTIWRLT
jgi:hypothetical protein